MKNEDFTIHDIKRGYVVSPCQNIYSCITCGKKFETGEIYTVGDRLFEAAKAIKLHVELEHSDYLSQLIQSDSKYNTLTENQKKLFQLFSTNLSDKEIAKQLGVTTSTIRHQKFIFREKAKQSKMYLATYENVFENKTIVDNPIIPIHDHANMVDERYVVTEDEKNHILETSFITLEPLKLKSFSPKEKKKVVILTKISEQFDTSKKYTEKEVNQILANIFEDFVSLRRYLIEYGFMKRNKDCTTYWLT